MDSEEKGKIKINRFTWGFLETNMYVLQAADKFLVIDPIDNAEILEKFKGSESVTVLLTHEHFDHICGLNKLREIASCKVIASKECSERIKDAKSNLSAYADILAEIAEKQVLHRGHRFVVMVQISRLLMNILLHGQAIW